MNYIHIKNLEKYNPGYTDRSLIWCKIYFSMINSSYEFENIDDVDKWRLIALIMLELQIKKPIPNDDRWLQRKISTNKRPISLTLKMLHNFIEYVTEDSETCNDSVTQSRVDKSRVEKSNSGAVKTIISYLNHKAKKKFSHTNKEALKLINGRLNEGRTIDDFEHVIDVKCEEWLDTNMEKYLRPITLFSPSKFETYVNQTNNVVKEEEMEDLA